VERICKRGPFPGFHGNAMEGMGGDILVPVALAFSTLLCFSRAVQRRHLSFRLFCSRLLFRHVYCLEKDSPHRNNRRNSDGQETRIEEGAKKQGDREPG